jgi:hypothetical protein
MNGFVEKSTHDMGIIVTVTINAKGMLLCLKHAAEITMILYVCNMKCYGIFVVIGND